MLKFEVLIEENVSGSVRPTEVIADIAIARLVPALVQELQLPQTDLFGKALVYLLRQSSGNRILPDNMTLQEAGVGAGERLALISCTQDGLAEALLNNHNLQWAASELHSSPTIADSDFFAALQRPANPSLLEEPDNRASSFLTRRTFLAAGAAILVASIATMGYATHGYLTGALADLLARTNISSASPSSLQLPQSVTAKQRPAFTQHQQTVRSLAWSPDGEMLASGADDKLVLLWQPDGKVRRAIQHTAPVQALAWSPDNLRLVTGSGTRMTFLNVLTGMEIAHFSHRHQQTITSVAWSAHRPFSVVSGSADRRAIIWDTTNYQAVTVFPLHTMPIEAVCWSDDGRVVASASQGGVIRIWRAADAQEVHAPYQENGISIHAVAFAPTDGRLAVGGDDGVVRLWNGLQCQTPEKGSALCLDKPQRLQVSQMAIHTLAWSPDGQWLAIGTDDTLVSLWNPNLGTKPMLIIPQQASVQAISWSADSKQIAVAAGNKVIIWSLM